MPAKTYVQTIINGEHVDFLCEPRQSLLEGLRDVIGLTGSKEGCNDGNCGACTVVFDGRIVTPCLVLGVEAEGKEITTIEGIATPAGLHPVQQAFLENAALQCGICTPGFIVALKGAARREPQSYGARDTLLAGKQSLPLHRLRQDRARRSGRGSQDAGGLAVGSNVVRGGLFRYHLNARVRRTGGELCSTCWQSCYHHWQF